MMMTLMPKTITMELLGVVVVLCGSGKHLEGPRWLLSGNKVMMFKSIVKIKSMMYC